MKLLYITNGITGSGGLERVLSVKCSLLADDRGYELHLLSLNEINKEPFFPFSKNIKIHTVEVGGNPISYFSQYKREIQKVVDEIQPDIISVCDDGLKGFFLPKLIATNAKWIYERHVSKLIEARSGQGVMKNIMVRYKWVLMEKLARYFSRFVVLTEGNKKEWTSLTNMAVIPNPLSFYPVESSLLNQKKIICVGKVSYQKGQDLLVKAWDKVWQKHPDWTMELYGKNNLDFLNTEKLQHKNIMHFPPEKNIMSKYLDSSIYVMSSRFEGFGMVLIEAMACGVPCVSFNCDYGPSDIILDKEDGLLVDKEDPKDLADKMNILIENREMRQMFGKKAKVNVQRFEQNVIAQQWDELFKTVQKEV